MILQYSVSTNVYNYDLLHTVAYLNSAPTPQLYLM